MNFISIDFDYFLHLHSHLNTGKGSKKPAYKKAVETGTANDDVDYEWIPRSALRTPGNFICSQRKEYEKLYYDAS